MPNFKEKNVDEATYLYVERSCSMDPEDVGNNMHSAFEDVWKFMEANSIKPEGPAISVYYTYEPDHMNFRAGFTISDESAGKANDVVKSDKTPSGKVLHFTHNGSYTTLRDDYAILMEHIGEKKLKITVPTWELYMNDPNTTSEQDLVTECYTKLA